MYYYCSKRQTTGYEAPQLHDVDVAVVEEGQQQQEEDVVLQGGAEQVVVLGVELTHSSSDTPTTTAVDVCVKLDDSVPGSEEEQV